MSSMPECVRCGNYIHHGPVLCADCMAPRPMEDAPRDGTPVLLALRDNLAVHLPRWEGVRFVGRHRGNEVDGWRFAAPLRPSPRRSSERETGRADTDARSPRT